MFTGRTSRNIKNNTKFREAVKQCQSIKEVRLLLSQFFGGEWKTVSGTKKNVTFTNGTDVVSIEKEWIEYDIIPVYVLAMAFKKRHQTIIIDGIECATNDCLDNHTRITHYFWDKENDTYHLVTKRDS